MFKLITDLTKPINPPALDAAIRALPGANGYVGHSAGFGKIIFWFGVEPDAAVQASVLSAYSAHNAADLTPEQTASQTAKNDWQTLVAAAEVALGQINDDLTLLGGTPTNAQVIGTLVRCIQRQRQIIRGLLFVARSIQ